MGESISQATIGTILRASQTMVCQDDEILEIETDKVNQVLYAPESGMLHLHVASQDVVDVGAEIGYIDTEAQETEKPVRQEPEKPQPQKPQSEKPQPEKPQPEKPQPEKPQSEEQRLIEKKPLEIKPPEIQPLIQEPLSVPPKQPPCTPSSGKEKRIPLSPLRKTLAEKLVRARRETASLTTFNEVDMSQVLNLRAQYKEEFEKKHGVKLGLMSFFVKAVVSALDAYPIIGALLEQEMLVYKETVDISIAVATDRGLVVPVLRDCKNLTFSEIEKAIKDFAVRAMEKKLTLDELQGGIFTITNGGVFGSLLSTPIQNYPQSAILGMHTITKRPHVVHDEIAICPMMNLALTYDHRLIDGKEAVCFLTHVKNCIEDPHRLELGI